MNSDVLLLHTRAKRYNINISEQYECVRLHMNNRQQERFLFSIALEPNQPLLDGHGGICSGSKAFVARS